MTMVWIISFIVLFLSLGAERLHARRVADLGRLAFGANREASMFAVFAQLLRAMAMTAMAWGLLTLLVSPPRQRLRDPNAAANIDPKQLKRVLLVLDVSPSMRIKDAAGGKLTRAQRAADVLTDMVSRVDFEKTRVTIAAFYTGVKPVVIDSTDPQIINWVVSNNSFDLAFRDGESDLGVAIRGAYKIAQDWRPDSTTLIVVTDGDSSPVGVLPPKPPSIARSLFLGVGDMDRGTFIDSHVSRQNAIELQTIAGQIGGMYADADGKFVPTDLLNDLSGLIRSLPADGITLREYAIAAFTLGAAVLCSIPALLTLLGTRLKFRSGPAMSSNHLVGVAR